MNKLSFCILFVASILFISCSESPDSATALIKPTLSDSNLSIYENSNANTVVGSVNIVSSGDRDITSYTIQGDYTNLFTIDTNGLITTTVSTLDYEQYTSYELPVYATSNAGDSSVVTVTVNITDVVEPFFDLSEGGDFGKSVSMDGDFLAVGGASDVYTYNIFDAVVTNDKIAAASAFAYEFGNSVSLDGEYLVVGAFSANGITLADTDIGKAYVFKKAPTEFTQIAELNASVPVAYGYYGRSVSMSGNYIAVGSNLDDATSIDETGSVYIYKIELDDSITQIAKLEASDASANDNFGYSVSMSGDYISVGAYSEDGGVYDSGAVYVFKRFSDNNVSEIAKIKADAQSGNNFGYSVSMDGDYIVAGAYNEGIDPANAGAAYLYKRVSDDNITRIAKLVVDDAKQDDNFGSSVSIKGNYIAVGASGDDTMNTNAGSVYIFRLNKDTNTTTQIAKVFANTQSGGLFGSSVSISGDNLSVGAPEVGDTYIYKLDTIP